MSRYDVVVIGAGPNGLTLANYLITSGARVLLVERRFDIGGSLLTEDFGGSRYNLHAFYMPLEYEIPAYGDLDLADYGCLFVEPKAQATVHTDSSKSLTIYRKREQTLKDIRKISPSDAKKFDVMERQIETMTREVILPWTYNPPMPPEKQAALLEAMATGKLALELADLSPVQIVDHYSIESQELRLLLLCLGCFWGIPPDQESTGLAFLSFLRGSLRAALIRGGSYLLASSLYKRAVMNGAQVLVGREVTKVLTKDGTVRGVELSDGRSIEARAVVSTIDVMSTFERLLGDQGASKEMSAVARKWKWDPWSLFQAHWTLKGKPRPKWKDGGNPEPLMHIVGYNSVRDFLHHVSAVNEGRTRPAGIVTFPTLLDPSQAAKGLTVARFTTMAPFRLKKSGWDELKDSFAEECFDAWSQDGANTHKGAILWKYAYPPTYIEMKLANCVRGSINGGAYIPEQLGYRRPSEDSSSYRTPVTGFYVAGAGVHPGGGITLAGGYNVAKVVAKDLGLKRWWRSKYSRIR